MSKPGLLRSRLFRTVPVIRVVYFRLQTIGHPHLQSVLLLLYALHQQINGLSAG